MQSEAECRQPLKPVVNSSAAVFEEPSSPPTPAAADNQHVPASAQSSFELTAGAAAQTPVPVNYAELYRERFRRELAEEQATAYRRVRRRAWRAWHIFSISWGFYILDPWEVAIVMCLLLLPFACVVLRICTSS